MTRVLSILALATLFATGVAVGGTVGPTPAYAQSEETCEQDEWRALRLVAVLAR